MKTTGTLKQDTAIAEDIPWSDELTSYDESHLLIYLRLLDADAARASLEEMASKILGIDPLQQPDRARHIAQRHLDRAKWMTERGYALLVRSARAGDVND